ncbi:MAG: amidohydrolase family protein [Rhodospirillaceae bacterium]|nr:amidohydrolase family protein [Rhodospirillaceae bacterium]MBT7645470.1 amidohydrolase family protein [Rhodospirillaceae bacterium]
MTNCELLSNKSELLVLPNLLNMHNHCIAATPFRGMSEDMPLETADEFPAELVYGLLLPMIDTLVETLDRDETSALFRPGLLEVIKGGTTTLTEVFRMAHEQLIELAIDMGLRLNAMVYLFSAQGFSVDENGVPQFEGRGDDQSMLDQWVDFHDRYDNAAESRVVVGASPHGTNTCSPELLSALHLLTEERKAPVTIHLSQTQSEEDLAQQRYGMSATRYLDSTGLLGPSMLAAHCLFLSDDDLALMKERGASVVNCPFTFARGGVFAPYHRFKDAGLRTVLGTDGYCMDIVGEMRAAGFISKLHGASPGKSSAWELVQAATSDSADFLNRPDLGRIRPGAAADLIAIDMNKAHFQPVSDPIKTFFWNGSRADIDIVMVDGQVLVNDGHYKLGDEETILREGAAAAQKAWQAVKKAGSIKSHYLEGI